MDKKYLDIKNTPLFCGVDSIDRLIDKCTAVRYRSGDNIDTKSNVVYVYNGSVLVYSKEEGRHILLRRIEAGNVYGVAGVLTDDPPVSHAVAKGSTELVLVPKSVVCELLENDKTFMYNYIAFLSDRVGYLNKKIACITAGSAHRKLAIYLSMFESDTVMLGTSISALSDMLDIGRASIYRSLERLETAGCIKRDGNKIIITDRKKLKEI